MGMAHDDGAAPGGRRDADLAVAAAAGDREALAAIYDRYASRVFALAVRQLRDRDAAADVTQEVFLTAAQRLGGLTDPERLRPWIFAVARHQIVDHVRRSQRMVPTDTVEDLDMTAATDGEGFDRVRDGELRTLLADSSAGLDDRDRMVLELAYGTELSGADLADALGVKENTAHQLLSRARQRMRTSLGALLVARQGREDCDELAALLESWDGMFSTVWRKRVARHVDGCEVCTATERRVLSPAALGAAFPVLLVPAEVRAQVLARLDLVSAQAGLSSVAPSGRTRDGSGPAGWREDGFPPEDGSDLEVLAGPTPAVRSRRGIGAVLAVGAVLLVGLFGAWWGASALAGYAPTVGEEVAGDTVDDAVARMSPASAETTSPGTAPTTTPQTTSAVSRSSTTADTITTTSPAPEPTGGATTAPPVDPPPVLVVNPAGPLRLSRTGVVELTVSHTGDLPAAVTVSVPDGFAADPALLDLGAGGFVGVTVRWLGSPNDPPPPPGLVTVQADGFQGASVEILPFRDATPSPSTTTPVTLVLPPLDPPVLLPPGPD
jgi:RNA polymerase sigma factor (sigma-70 family)